MNRRTRLKARTQLRRTGPPTRKARMRTTSSRRRQELDVRAVLAHEYLGAPCRLKLEVCTGAAEHWHELVASGQGGSKIDRRNIVPSCDACNSYLETLPDRYDRRLKVRSWDAVPGVDGLVPALPHPLAIASDQGGWT